MLGVAVDITELKQAENALRENEEQFRAMFEMASIGMAQADPDAGRFLLVNQKMCAITGYSKDELLKLRVPDITHPEDRAHDWALFQRVVCGKSPNYRLEKRYVRKDGAIIWVNVNMTVIRDGAGRPVRTMATIEDITERKLAVEAIAAREQHLNAILETSQDGFWLVDTQGRIREVNAAACAISGYSRKELLRMSIGDIDVARTQRVIAANIRRIMQEGSARFESRQRCKDGRVIDVEVSINFLNLDGGQFVSFIHDITARKQAEEALRESERQYRLLADNVEDFVTVLDAQENRLYVSPSFFRLTGWKSEEVMGTAWDARLHPEDIPLITQSRTANWAGQSTLTEHRIHCRDNSWIWVEARCKPILGPAGEVTQLLIWQHDITERKLADEALRQSREQLRALAAHLETLREEQSILIAREIHDELGQTLTGVKLDLAWLRKRLPAKPALRAKVARLSKHIDGLITTMQRICSELRPSMLDDLGLVSAFQSYTEQFEQRTGLKCRLELPAEDFELDRARTTAIFRIFQETLTNIARHACATQALVRLGTTGHHVELKVTDNGRGITPAELAHPQSFGLLGMRERVLALDGAISINGVAGRGTTVTVTIPTGGRS